MLELKEKSLRKSVNHKITINLAIDFFWNHNYSVNWIYHLVNFFKREYGCWKYSKLLNGATKLIIVNKLSKEAND